MKSYWEGIWYILDYGVSENPSSDMAFVGASIPIWFGGKIMGLIAQKIDYH